ncbi:uncharacterized protein LOC114281958 isoform X1 [Camellia sinensis]|uniref:uncharacterized protein LOC114281958 isoform X1 n=1 Tax=Camellia sinensis TaxID=4442 RepID=UPI00103694F9|nr:uncharacterized protein LOC114281958 isoform X1 [Camellia sinensis]XP_028080344.1 uncharacterized protein LOC114281958 isoform X1 [Camellia sinensis]XP_028080345.1 uncharacterized protein LOC114281958 isoform X1 [Camellia sinensis]XP_028080346.1 uncharacterized protein LOC114281958 isoform X1 [Camellia sinensis]XP_028080347.1 uncharacterized protein LOC114281958 isoform X1 [Camellia sinensis]
MMTMAAKCDSSTTFPLFAFRKFITPSQFCSRRKISFLIVNKAESSFSNVKRANLAARKKDRVKLPNYNDGGGGKRIYHISEFLSHPSGIEAILNTSALQSFQFLDANLYRCTLPRVQLLNFEVAPVLDLRVTPTDEDCTVEMLSCKFVGSEVLERQNEHFSASMRNRITWDPNDTEPFLDVDVKLNLTLEIYTQPFTMLPISAVEGPGNLMMQTLLDRLVPLLVQQLLQDYSKWVQQQSRYLQ